MSAPTKRLLLCRWSAATLVVVGLLGAYVLHIGSFTLLDDWLIVGDRLWPPSSDDNVTMRSLGREYSVIGLYFHLLRVVFGTWAPGFYAVGYSFFAAAVFIVYALVALLAGAPRWAFVASLLCATTSGAPQVLLTLFTPELRLAAFVLAIVAVLAAAMTADEREPRGSWRARRLFASSFAPALVGGAVGKETVLFVPLALIVTLLLIAGTRGVDDRRAARFIRTLAWVSAGSGAAIVCLFAWRAWMGVATPFEGAYVTRIIELHPSKAGIIDRFKDYLFAAPDTLTFTGTAAVLVLWRVVPAFDRRRRPHWTATEVVALTAAVFATGHLIFFVFLMSWIQVYYLFPGTLCAVLAVVLFVAGGRLVPARATTAGRLALAAVLLAALAYAIVLGEIRFVGRMTALPAAQRQDTLALEALAELGDESQIYLSWGPKHEVHRSVATLLRGLHGTKPRFVRSISELTNGGNGQCGGFYASNVGHRRNWLVVAGRNTLPRLVKDVRAAHPFPLDEVGELVYSGLSRQEIFTLWYSPPWPRKWTPFEYGWKIWRFRCPELEPTASRGRPASASALGIGDRTLAAPGWQLPSGSPPGRGTSLDVVQLAMSSSLPRVEVDR